jgi:hypothetical protein
MTDVQNTACLPGNTKVPRLEDSELAIRVVYTVIQLTRLQCPCYLRCHFMMARISVQRYPHRNGIGMVTCLPGALPNSALCEQIN